MAFFHILDFPCSSLWISFPQLRGGFMGLVMPFYLGVMKFDSNPDKKPGLFMDFENFNE
jgi:hypothetical protein